MRRLVDLAVVDNYAMYRAFLVLKKHPNSDVLIVSLLRDADSSTEEVLEVIFNAMDG